MDRKYHRSLLANIHLIYELLNQSVTRPWINHIYKVLISEIHYCASKNSDVNCHDNEASLFNKVLASKQMTEYKNSKNNKNIPKLRATINDKYDMALVADIYLLNLMLYDVHSSVTDCIKNVISIIHWYELSEECIKIITKSPQMVEYKTYLKMNRTKKELKKKIRNPDFLANVYLYQKLRSNGANIQVLENVITAINSIYNIYLTPELLKYIVNSKFMDNIQKRMENNKK